MDEQRMGEVQPAAGDSWQQSVPPAADYAYTPQPGAAATAVPSSEGLSDTAAGALAYVTIIPAIIFLVMAPYNTKPFVKFHSFQSLGLGVVWFCLGIVMVVPILGWIVGILGMLALAVCWILSIIKASQGGAFKLPVISEFAAKQSGYQP